MASLEQMIKAFTEVINAADTMSTSRNCLQICNFNINIVNDVKRQINCNIGGKTSD